MHMALRYNGYYEVDAAGNGTLPCGTPISTYYVEDKFPPLDLSHPNLLHIFFTNYAKREVVCARRGDPLIEWLERQPSPSLVGYPISENTEEDQAGSKEKKKKKKEKEEKKKKEVKAFSFSPQLRNFIAGMLRAVCYVHEKGYSIKELSEENICILDDELRVWKLNFVEKTTESQNHNFRSIANIISRILELPNNLNCNCPPDVRSLLKLLKSNSAAVHKKKILHHMAMVLPEMRLMLVDEMFQMGRCEETAEDWGKAADVFFVEANLNDWVVKYKKKMKGHVLKCYDYRNKSIPYIVKLDEDSGVQKADVVGSFLNFLRNLVHHLGHDKRARRRLPKVAIDAILFWAFGNEIVLFKECLDRVGLASTFWSGE